MQRAGLFDEAHSFFLKAGKNLVGTFHQPKLVLCDLGTLETLPDREFRAGLAEVIKYGIIYDAGLFRKLERDLPKILRREPNILATVIARCCAIKAEVVSQDENDVWLVSVSQRRRIRDDRKGKR